MKIWWNSNAFDESFNSRMLLEQIFKSLCNYNEHTLFKLIASRTNHTVRLLSFFFYFGLGMLMHMYVVYIFIYIKYPTHSMRSVSINNVQNVACLSCFPSNDLFAMENFSDLWFSLVCISYRYSEIRSLLNRWFYLFHPLKNIIMKNYIWNKKNKKKWNQNSWFKYLSIFL